MKKREPLFVRLLCGYVRGCLLCSCFFLYAQVAEAAHFKGITPTPTMVDFIGYMAINGQGAAIADEIGVFDDQGILVGGTEITRKGQYSVLHVYGDDSTTPKHDGAGMNSVLTFKIWQASTQTELVIPEDAMSTQCLGGAFGQSAIPPRWTGDKNRYVMNIAAKVTVVPIVSGWGIMIMAFLLCSLAGYVERKRARPGESRLVER